MRSCVPKWKELPKDPDFLEIELAVGAPALGRESRECSDSGFLA